MILSDLKQAIVETPGITRQSLAERFALSEDGVDAMLTVWIKKGVLTRTEDRTKTQALLRVRYHLNQSGALSLKVIM
ncbi:FeoC-like transcriptional regulator [Vibrio sp. ZSDZ34]|jgi:putative ferrous iron transport protein C|uniref:FeoC-like transcriptional regulator n=1 Tax=Vibrio gelatinilyticus TaxID=2893468 RepID=A0A9X2AUU2_9VIBR|nr:FeoC-like transcriptional regulator [Vibrio gelatinilyticus]MCJ2375685.1 FeoC-like transcriptional regulator [Vibrio gelatinilyticus]